MKKCTARSVCFCISFCVITMVAMDQKDAQTVPPSNTSSNVSAPSNSWWAWFWWGAPATTTTTTSSSVQAEQQPIGNGISTSTLAPESVKPQVFWSAMAQQRAEAAEREAGLSSSSSSSLDNVFEPRPPSLSQSASDPSLSLEEWPALPKTNRSKSNPATDEDGFTQVPSRRRKAARIPAPQTQENNS